MTMEEWRRNIFRYHRTYEQQISFLKKDGMLITDYAQVSHHLKHIGLGALMPYLCYFWHNDPEGKYLRSVSWNSVYSLYEFNDDLRLLLLQATGKVETTLLELLAYYLEQSYGSYWHLKPTVFKYAESNKVYEDIWNFVQKRKKNEHHTFQEAKIGMSLGMTYRIYSQLENHSVKEIIASAMGMPPVQVFSSSIYAITNLRNCCAHPQRIWNKRFNIIPDEFYYTLTHTWLNNNMKVDRRRIYYLFCLLNYFMQVIDPDFGFVERLCALLEQYKDVISFTEMGFTDDWKEEPMWKI